MEPIAGRRIGDSALLPEATGIDMTPKALVVKISLEEPPNEAGQQRFRWIAISGSFARYLNGVTPRFFSPAGRASMPADPSSFA